MQSTPSNKLSVETKGIISGIVNKLMNIVNLDFFKTKIENYVGSEYKKGLEKSESMFNMNFIPVDGDVEFLKQYVFDNMQKHTDDISENLRGELSRGLLNKEGVNELKERVRTVFKDKKYTNRLKTVMRTEKNRANNMGALDGAIQSGLNLRKYLDVTMDNRTSDICKAEARKYPKDKAIPLNEEFVVKANNKIIRGQAPSFHPNCRTVLRFVRVEE